MYNIIVALSNLSGIPWILNSEERFQVFAVIVVLSYIVNNLKATHTERDCYSLILWICDFISYTAWLHALRYTLHFNSYMILLIVFKIVCFELSERYFYSRVIHTILCCINNMLTFRLLYEISNL